ncbi:hypothetical protein JRO89_XSUnG0056200 [Xanthoceras sorbifolium]|uniref:S-acyltransferase n=1 Tax=Xanthoceras sorbifolium TaxID=99658 RepID=A0ABQ8GZT7_9ROSI|nr:hypothetical protein JRO89_XSUnG0056200 [Xanthoceras sorbifolium]
MVRLHDEKKLLGSLQLIGRCTVSCIFVLLAQFSLSLVPRFFSASPFLLQFALSALLLLVVLGIGSCCRRLLGLHSSAPAFVFFNILFIWSFYVAVVRKVTSSLMDGLFNAEVAIMIIGLCSIQSTDPGLATHETLTSDKLVQSSSFGVDTHNQNSLPLRRIRYCKICKAHIKGLDHHCPAFGNCIGQNNYVLFMVLLVGFLTTETSYLVCSAQCKLSLAFGMGINKPKLGDPVNSIRSHIFKNAYTCYFFFHLCILSFFFPVVRNSRKFGRNSLEINLVGNLAISTMLFSIFQVLWQGVFLMWHVYCICFNVRTDEWINWKKYPEFQVVCSEPGESFSRVTFRNPYDKGILQNIKDFVALRE